MGQRLWSEVCQRAQDGFGLACVWHAVRQRSLLQLLRRLDQVGRRNWFDVAKVMKEIGTEQCF